LSWVSVTVQALGIDLDQSLRMLLGRCRPHCYFSVFHTSQHQRVPVTVLLSIYCQLIHLKATYAGHLFPSRFVHRHHLLVQTLLNHREALLILLKLQIAYLNLVHFLSPESDVFLDDRFEWFKHRLKLEACFVIQLNRRLKQLIVIFTNHLHELSVLMAFILMICFQTL